MYVTLFINVIWVKGWLEQNCEEMGGIYVALPGFHEIELVFSRDTIFEIISDLLNFEILMQCPEEICK